VQVVVLADTHAPRRWQTCPPAVAVRLRGADLILHAGDVCTAAVLDELAAYAPVRAVARLIVFGHSHIPWNETADGVRAFNPGSPTDRRSQPQGTIGLLRIEDGQVIDAHVIPVT
jgi:predicted phosphodiesterase